ncbi:hypothetical protein PV327_010370 [Microctonus hyperodae]|uniref:Uncharacterized protein n=1 Tax=Microctonus hyperodae TaxID=165561 RepID=A0AA39KUX2_MICHY|nr:hypothetical protein PV327_010370 [Microctonus hyperodae]
MSVHDCDKPLSILLDCELKDGWLLFQWIKSHWVWCNCTRIVDKCHIITVHTATLFFLDKINWWQQTARQRGPQRGLYVDSQRPLRRHYSRKADIFPRELVNKRPQSVRRRGEDVSPVRAVQKALRRVPTKFPGWHSRHQHPDHSSKQRHRRHRVPRAQQQQRQHQRKQPARVRHRRAPLRSPATAQLDHFTYPPKD